ncbi:hypothetical protein [Streptomyces silvisoli]|uniref:hypothetical protein n=1 Tax=Streptomyces silvisoli TaxID=3034235 RepID=UPI0028BE2E93|nr:hypothetical protein [Streptomyces silvisoli]
MLAGSPLGPAPDLPGPSALGFLVCASVVRRAAFVDAGGVHPLLHFGGEEALLAIDLTARGWGAAHCPLPRLPSALLHRRPVPGWPERELRAVATGSPSAAQHR